MNERAILSFFVATQIYPAMTARAEQGQPSIRQLGPIISVTHDTLGSASAAVQVTGGQVYLNDMVGHRLLLYDSALAKAVVVADSSEGANAYGNRPGSLLRYRGDSALFVSPEALSMLVLSPSGTIARVMAMPPSGRGMPALLGNFFGTPGFDARGRLVYFAPARPPLPPARDANAMSFQSPDSAFIVRFDFESRRIDSLATIRVPSSRSTGTRDDQGRVRMTMTAFPPKTVDGWSVTSDGSVAIVRGQDYHVDWLAPDGSWTSSPRIPFDWERMSDEGKAALVDSVAAATQTMFDSMAKRMQLTINAGGDSTARRRGNRADPMMDPMRGMTIVRAQPSDVPDYRPPFGGGAVRADVDGNLWVQTSKVVDHRPVYDIINRAGQLTDRIQLPAFRTIAGFGPGIVYLGVKDSAGVVHMERARIR
jgi:hypothetical protein